MTRDGLTEENLHDGTVKDISHKSRGRPEEKQESLIPERERKKPDADTDEPDGRKRKQRNKIRQSSVRQESVESGEDVTQEEQISGYRKKLRDHEKIPDGSTLDGQKKTIRKKQIQKQMTKEQAKAGRLSFDDEGNQMVRGSGMKPGGTAGRLRMAQRTVSDIRSVLDEEDDTEENA